MDKSYYITEDIQSGFDFEVEVAQNTYTTLRGNTKPSKNVTLYNSATEAEISVRAKSYNLMTNSSLFATGLELSRILGVKIDHLAVHREGKDIAIAFRENASYSIGKYKFKNHIILTDNRGGNFGVRLSSIGTLNRCSNIFGSVKKNRTASIRHNSSMEQNIQGLLDDLEKFQLDKEKHLEYLNSLQDIKFDKEAYLRMIAGFQKMTEQEIHDFAKGSLELPTKKKNILEAHINSWNVESKELGNTAFAAWNAVTHYSTHFKRSDKSNISLQVFGNAPILEKQTFEFINTIV